MDSFRFPVVIERCECITHCASDAVHYASYFLIKFLLAE
jgi:hypothetical protein